MKTREKRHREHEQQEEPKHKKDPAPLKKLGLDAPNMVACHIKPPAVSGVPKQHAKYYTKRPADIESLRRKLAPVRLIHDDPVQRPGLFVANTGVLGNQLGVYAEKDIIVGHSARKLIGYYAGEFFDVMPETMDSNHYVFVHDDGGVIDAKRVRNWAAFINHSEINNAVHECVEVDGEKRIYIYAVNDIRANQPVYINYGPDYFFNMDFPQVYLGRHDNWKSPADLYDEHRAQYCNTTFQFNKPMRKGLGLLSKGAYVVPVLFKAVLDGDLDKVDAMLNDKHCMPGLMPLAIDEKTGKIAASDRQEKITPYMLACHLGHAAIIARFVKHYKKGMAKTEDFTLFVDRSWRNGKTPLMYLLNGVASKHKKQEIFARFMSLKQKLEKGKFILNPYFVLQDASCETLLGYCIRHQLHDTARSLLANVDICEALYQVMYEDRIHANLDTCISNDDLVMLDILLKNAADPKVFRDNIASNFLNLRKCPAELVKKAEPTLNKYLKLNTFSSFKGGLFKMWQHKDIQASKPIRPRFK